MRNQLSSLKYGCLGLCAGFTFCYVYLVLPERVARAITTQPQFVAVPTRAGDLDWRPYMIYPTNPPKFAGR